VVGAGDRRRIALTGFDRLAGSAPATEPTFEDFDPASEVIDLVERVEAAKFPVDGTADQHGLVDAFARCPCGDLPSAFSLEIARLSAASTPGESSSRSQDANALEQNVERSVRAWRSNPALLTLSRPPYVYVRLRRFGQPD
jgi:hypothetical protein